MLTRKRIIVALVAVAVVLAAMSLAFVVAPQKETNLNNVVRVKQTPANSNAKR